MNIYSLLVICYILRNKYISMSVRKIKIFGAALRRRADWSMAAATEGTAGARHTKSNTAWILCWHHLLCYLTL